MRIIRSTDWKDGVRALSKRLTSELDDGRRVLWLVSGGSNLMASVQVMNTLTPQASRGLSIMPVDERYGEVGHPDSNWAQLLQAGLAAKQATLLPVLVAGKTFEKTIEYYRRLLENALTTADCIIAQLGIGQDGHLAGILPGSPATSAVTDLVIGYDAPPYRRLTLTFPALRQATAVYAFAYGDDKHQALAGLAKSPLDLTRQPAQILMQLPEVYLYNDQIGEIS